MITYILAVDTDPLFNQLDQKYYKFSPEKFRSLYQMKVGTGAGFVFFLRAGSRYIRILTHAFKECTLLKFRYH